MLLFTPFPLAAHTVLHLCRSFLAPTASHMTMFLVAQAHQQTSCIATVSRLLSVAFSRATTPQVSTGAALPCWWCREVAGACLCLLSQNSSLAEEDSERETQDVSQVCEGWRSLHGSCCGHVRCKACHADCAMCTLSGSCFPCCLQCLHMVRQGAARHTPWAARSRRGAAPRVSSPA